MKLHLKKNTLNIIIVLLASFTVYPINSTTSDYWVNQKIDTSSSNFTIKTDKETITSHTITHEDRTTIIVDRCNHETGQTEHIEKPIYHNDPFTSTPNSFDTNLSHYPPDPQSDSNNNDSSNKSARSSNEGNVLYDYCHDATLERCRQEIENNHIAQPTNIHTQPLDFKLILDKVYTIQDLINALLSPTVRAHLQEVKRSLIYTHRQKHHLWTASPKIPASLQRELDFIDALLSGEIIQLLKQMQHPNLRIAETSFDILKKLWIWPRKNMFLGPDLTWGSLEPKFIKNLGVNVMSIAEKGLITRPDYIEKHADAQSLKTIQAHKEQYILLQQKGDIDGLFGQAITLYDQIKKNGKKENFTTNICYALSITTARSPITTSLHYIAHAPSAEKAHKSLRFFENKILAQANKENINLDFTIKDWLIENYGFDVLAAACGCYKSRADYNSKPLFINLFSPALRNDESILSNPLYTVLHKIQQKPLPMAHTELTRLVKQVLEQFESLNITDPVKQKQILIEDFGVDVITVANNTYKNNPDHKILMHSFIPIDVPSTSIEILSNHHDYASVGQEFDVLAGRVFDNARLCNLEYVPEVEAHVFDSLHVIRAPRNDAEFVFNVTIVDHLLTDMQSQADAIIQGEVASIKRMPELFTRAVSKFINGLNPVTQVTNICELIEGISILSNKALNIAVDALDHPVNAVHNALEVNAKACDFLVDTARFTADLTIGKIYLDPEQHKQRTEPFWQKYNAIVTGENIADLVGQVAADFAFGKGLGIAFVYLKEIDAVSKLENQAAKIASKFKQAADTHLANSPILVTTEGVALQMSNDLKNVGGVGKEIITDSRIFIESMTSGLLAEVKQEIIALRKQFTCIEKCLPDCAKKGFAEFKNGHIKIAYEHILGIELIWNDAKGTLSGISGFHHDFMGTVEKSGLLKFVRKAEKNGCYMADIFVGEKRVTTKTFFPQHWSREDVASKIYEAYENFIKSGATPLEKGGKYIIEGTTKEGIEIRMFITKNGHIKTTYPIVKEGI